MQGIIVDFFVKPEFPQNIAPEEIRLKRHLQVPVLALQIYGHIAVGLRDDKIGLVSAEPYVNGAKAESGNGIVILDGPVECGKCVGREGGRGEGKVDPAAGGVVEPGVVSLGSAAPGQNQERWLERSPLAHALKAARSSAVSSGAATISCPEDRKRFWCSRASSAVWKDSGWSTYKTNEKSG